jgi:hypothetical protein
MLCFGLLIMFCEPQKPPAPPPASTYCQIKTKPVFFSPKDTRETKEQIDTENRVWKRLCRPSAAK